MLYRIITHSADPDGVVSNALLVSLIKLRDADYQVGFADYPNLKEVIAQAAGREERESLFIADLTLNERPVPDAILRPLLENHLVYYFDHHPLSSEKRVAELKKGCAVFKHTSAQQCASLLLLSHFGLRKSKPHKFMALVAQSMDYPGTVDFEIELLGRQMNRIIRPESGLDLTGIVEKLADSLLTGKEWYATYGNRYLFTGEWDDAYKKVAKQIDEAQKSLEASITIHPMGGLKIACAKIPKILYMKDGLHHLRAREGHADLFFCFYEGMDSFIGDHHNGKFQDEGQLPLLPFIRTKGGGGRENSGGFNFQGITDNSNYQPRRDLVLEEFAKYLEAHNKK